MIELGRRKVVVKGVADRVRLSVAPAETLPFADATFDAATVAFGLRNGPDRRQALVEMHRVLRPGGRAVILEFTTPPGWLFRKIYLWYFHRVLPRIGGWISGHRTAYAYRRHRWGNSRRPTGTAWAEVGFQGVSYRLMTFGIVAIHVGIKGSG
jgi:demethylmenaquinone methyltransferase/2-methoxy-6-polyprenyl-1,4-benzoquinol methylase